MHLLIDEQKYIFDVNEACSGIPYNISFEIQFSKRFLKDQLRIAVEQCLLSADISGAKCVAEGDCQYMDFLPPKEIEILENDFSSVAQYQAYCGQIGGTELNNRERLFFVLIYSIDGSPNNLYFRFNHLVFDGVSAILLFEAVQKVLADNSTEISWYPFSDHLDKINRYKTSEKYLSDHDFWEDLFSDLSSCEHVFPDATDIDESAASSLKFQSSKVLKINLLAYCTYNEIPPHILILSVFSQLISERYGCKRFSMEVPIGNRIGKKEKNSLGVYEIAAPIIFDFNRHTSTEEIVNSVKRQFRAFYRHKDFDWNIKIFSPSYMSKYGRYVPQLLYSYFCFNKNCSMGFASLHHTHSRSCNQPINLYISDYSEFEEFNFHYIFWSDYISPEVVVEIQRQLVEKLTNIIENRF